MSSKPHKLHIQRLRELSFWQHAISVEPLPGGITNHNYVVRDGDQSYVARLCEDRSILGIDRRNEVACQRAAHAIGIAPEVAHHEGGTLVSRLISGRTLTAEDVRGPTLLPRIAVVLKRLHDSWDQLTGEVLAFSAFQAVRTYAERASRLGARLPGDIDALLEDTRRLARALGPYVPVLCHNDMLASNLIVDDRLVWLVDWEYAGMGHPLFDLANLSANCGFSDELDHALLAAYGGDVRPGDLRDLRTLKAASYLREALWSVIQTVASDLDFDYETYASENLRAYREARGRLGG